MGDASKNLSRKEFKCQCGCGFDTVDFELINVLQDMIDYFTHKYDHRIYCIITGGNRCVQHNEEVQLIYNKNYMPFSSNSQHTLARAADFKLYGQRVKQENQISPSEIYDYLCLMYPNEYGIGLYVNRNHLDTRSGNSARWGK